MNISLITNLSYYFQKHKKNSLSSEEIMHCFFEALEKAKVDCYEAQSEAILEAYCHKNVILNTPTGSGKSLVATAVLFLAVMQGKRAYYTCPIKALVNEKFLDACNTFGAPHVGLITGDAAVNTTAPIICCTAEILSLDALTLGSTAAVDYVIMDEFHYFSDKERGMAWQIPLLELPQAQFLLMSATLGDMLFIEKALTRLNKKPTVTVVRNHRPVPLHYEYSEYPLYHKIKQVVDQRKDPLYVVNFSQKQCVDRAADIVGLPLCDHLELKRLQHDLGHQSFDSPYGKELKKLLLQGIGIHHAGLLPKYRILVERLAGLGLLKVIMGTDTLGVGINIPIRTVLFTQLYKFNGSKTALLSVRDFLQISGRAGRKGFDDVGYVVVQAPEHIVNKKQPFKGKKKLYPSIPLNFVPWNKDTFLKLVHGKPRVLESRFEITYGVVLFMLSRQHEDGCRALARLIRHSLDPEERKKSHRKKAASLFRSLVGHNIICLNPLRVNVDLQDDFSLHNTLSVYLVDTIAYLDREDQQYALKVLTLVESILENPDVILRRQVDRLRNQKRKQRFSESSDDDYATDDLTHPQPDKDFLDRTFHNFAIEHPWVWEDPLKPKNIAREMFEHQMGFSAYVKLYKIERSEGLLLRYLSEVTKTLMRTVPEYAKDSRILEVIQYFETIVREVDASLIDEWNRIGGLSKNTPSLAEPIIAIPQVSHQRTAFEKAVIKTIFLFLTDIFSKKLSSAQRWVVFRNRKALHLLRQRLQEYRESCNVIETHKQARLLEYTIFSLAEDFHDTEPGDMYNIEQQVVDHNGPTGWSFFFVCSLHDYNMRHIVRLEFVDFRYTIT